MAGAPRPGYVREVTDGTLGYYVDGAGKFHRALTRRELLEAVRSGVGQLWLDIDSRRDEEWALLSDLFGFHPLAVEDTRSPNCRVKLEEYDGYLFVVVRGIRFAMETPEPYDIDTRNLYLFIGTHFLVTVHADRSGSIRTVAERIEAGPEMLARGVDYLAHVVVDTLVDYYFPLLDQIDDFIDDLEHDILVRGDGLLMGKIFDLKRSLLKLRRHLAPMREVMITLANRPTAYLKPEMQIYFRDVYDHVVRQVESIETYRELLTGAMETHLSMLSNRMNEIMKALSVIATVVLPPTLVASIYGMNFEWMPGLHSPFGFWIAVVAMIGISLGFLMYLWRKRWL